MTLSVTKSVWRCPLTAGWIAEMLFMLFFAYIQGRRKGRGRKEARGLKSSLSPPRKGGGLIPPSQIDTVFF